MTLAHVQEGLRLRLEDAAAAARHQAALAARAEGQLASMRASAMAAAAEAAQVLFTIHGIPSETPGQGLTACAPLPPPPPAQVPGTAPRALINPGIVLPAGAPLQPQLQPHRSPLGYSALHFALLT